MTSVKIPYYEKIVESGIAPLAGAIPKLLELALKPILARLTIIEKKLGIEAPEQPKSSTKTPAAVPTPKKKEQNRGDRVVPSPGPEIR